MKDNWRSFMKFFVLTNKQLLAINVIVCRFYLIQVQTDTAVIIIN